MRRLLLLALGCLSLLGLAPTAYTAQERPNILLLTAEDLSPRIAAFGDPVAQTPNLDRLASQGVRYPNTFTSAGVCAPSRAAMMTGVRQTAIGGQHMRVDGLQDYRAVPPPEVKAFPELLRRAGYFTFTTNKLDYQFSGVFPGSGPFTIWDRETLGYADWSERAVDKPFYGQINYGVTHESGIFPFTWPRSATHALLTATRFFQYGFGDDVMDPSQVPLPPYYPDTEVVRRDVARQYENVHIMDQEVGETLAALERDGLADSTIVIWTTDHGDGLPRAKRELFDSGIRVPMIIRWPERFRPPGVAPGTIDRRMISFVDLAPTILALAGIPTPPWMDGRAFVGENAAPPRRYVFAARDRLDEAPDRQRAVRDARYKYIRNYEPGTAGASAIAFRENQDIMRELTRLFEEGKLDDAQRKWFEPRPVDELYDTREDPHEVVNLAADPGHQEVLKRLQLALDRWLAERPDLGELPEKEMIDLDWPGGEQPLTQAPEVEIHEANGDRLRIEMRSPTRGASIGYRLVDHPTDADSWRIYDAPFEVKRGTNMEAKAVRYGWAESSVTTTPTR